MPEPFKTFLNETLVREMGARFAAVEPDFDQDGFQEIATARLAELELKARAASIADAMASFLPKDFEHAALIIRASLAPYPSRDESLPMVSSGLAGWAVLPMNDYVGRYGLQHFDCSMALLKDMTKRFTAEFGIRFFLLDNPKRTLAVLESWTSDSDHHVRRLVSEGTRPRLPWAMRLPMFMKDPSPVIRLLEHLKDDPEEYVRRSVANNLNDISKDHPERVVAVARRWLRRAGVHRQRLVRHACRTLIKGGHTEVFSILGYSTPKITLRSLRVSTSTVRFGDALTFEVDLRSTSAQSQSLVMDYAIHHRKRNGGTTRKVFKWKTVRLEARATLSAVRTHAFKAISTRVYYPGRHDVELLVNGTSVGRRSFELVM